MTRTEYLDIIEQNGQPLGRKKPRSLVHHDGDWHKTVHVWIVNSAQEVLFQKRALQKESFPGIWDVSSAGHISAGDTSEASAIKEVSEELGLAITLAELHYVYTLKNSLIQDNGNYVDNELSDVYVVWKDVALKELALQESEVCDATFITMQALKKIADFGDDAYVPREDEYKRLYDFIRSQNS